MTPPDALPYSAESDPRSTSMRSTSPSSRFVSWPWRRDPCKLLRYRVVPAAVRRDERVSFFGPPGAGLVWTNPRMSLEDAIDRGPRGLHCVLAREQCPIAGHGIAEQPLVGRFFSR